MDHPIIYLSVLSGRVGSVLAVALLTFSYLAPSAIGKSALRAGSHKQREEFKLPRNDYERLIGTERTKLEVALSDICPSFLINVENSSGNIYVLDPRKVEDLPDKQRKMFHSKKRRLLKKNFCALYSKHRAGCNMIWKVSNSKKPIHIWRTKTYEEKTTVSDGDSRMRPGHIGWNAANPIGAEVEGSTDPTPETPIVWSLAHELGHAYRWVRDGYKDPTWTDPKLKDREKKSEKRKEEEAAVRAENQIRAELRKLRKFKRKQRCLSPRKKYRGKDVPQHDSPEIDTEDIFGCDKNAKQAILEAIPDKPPLEQKKPRGRIITTIGKDGHITAVYRPVGAQVDNPVCDD